MGININQAEIEPGRLDPTSLGINSESIDLNNQHSLEAAIFLNTDVDLSTRLSFTLGLRFSNFWRYGEDEIFTYDENDFMSFDTLPEFNSRRRWERIIHNVIENPEFYACMTSLNRKTFSIK